jgi:hypothetical protein
MRANQFSTFLHQQVRILRRLPNQLIVRSTTQRLAGYCFLPGIGHSSSSGTFFAADV